MRSHVFLEPERHSGSVERTLPAVTVLDGLHSEDMPVIISEDYYQLHS